MQRRKMLRLLAISQRRRRTAFLMGMSLLLAFVLWLRLSAKAHAWLAKLASTRSSILTHPLPEALFVVGMVVVLALWLLPRWQAARSRGLTTGNRFDRENEARKTLAQIIGGVFVLAGLYSSLQTFDLQREGQITDRFTKAIDQLGAVEGTAMSADVRSGVNRSNIKLEVRLGGIYALERIAQDSPKDHWTIIEVLTAYVRENSPTIEGSEQTVGKLGSLPTPIPPGAETKQPHVRADIQAILTVIGRRNVAHDPPDRIVHLPNANLVGADLVGAHLEKADVIGADLRGAFLRVAHLKKADVIGADLSGAHLRCADLTGADLSGADLTGADLPGADLSGAHLNRVDLAGADLSRADLKGADLTGAIGSIGADLSGADLGGADLSGADLTGAKGITPSQLNDAFGDKNTQLPDGDTPPLSWNK